MRWQKNREHPKKSRNQRTGKNWLEKITPKKSEHRMLFAFLLNLSFAVFEVIGGLFTGSVTILSDALHDFCDSVALFFAFFMEKLSKKKPDASFPFGYQRFSVLSGFVNNLILVICSCFILYHSYQSIFITRDINEGGMLLFAVFGILVNGAAMLITTKGKNVNERTISVHMLEDVLTWGAVLVVSIVMFFFEVPVLDSVLSLLIALVILLTAGKNLKDIFFLLAMKSPMKKAEQEKLLCKLQKISSQVVGLNVSSADGVNRCAYLVLEITRTVVWREQKHVIDLLSNELSINGINEGHILIELRQLEK